MTDKPPTGDPAVLERLLALSLDPNGLDWEALSNINRLGWGHDEDETTYQPESEEPT